MSGFPSQDSHFLRWIDPDIDGRRGIDSQGRNTIYKESISTENMCIFLLIPVHRISNILVDLNFFAEL